MADVIDFLHGSINAHMVSGDFIKDCGVPGRHGDGINMALMAGGAEWTHMDGVYTADAAQQNVPMKQ